MAQLEAADADLAAAARQRFPRLTLSAALGLLSFNLSSLFESNSLVGSLGAGLAAPLIDFGRIEAEIDGAAADKKAAFAAYRGARKSGVEGKIVSVRVDLGGTRIFKK